MNNSLNIKQINQFICVGVIIYRFEDKWNTHIHPSEWQVSEYASYEQWACVEATFPALKMHALLVVRVEGP